MQVVRVALAVQAVLAVPAGRPSGRPEEARALPVRNVRAARLVI